MFRCIIEPIALDIGGVHFYLNSTLLAHVKSGAQGIVGYSKVIYLVLTLRKNSIFKNDTVKN
jgi:hypothetical protein